MDDDALRRALRAAAGSYSDPSDPRPGAERRAALTRRRRTRIGAYGGSVLATVAVLAATVGLRPGSQVPDPVPPVAGTAPGTAGPPSRTPAPTAPSRAGATFGAPVVTDDFTGPLDASRWVVYSDGSPSTYARWAKENVSVRDGRLDIAVRRPGGDYPAYTTGGVGAIPLAREYGRFSVRLRMTPGYNVVGQVVLAPVDPGDIGALLTIGSDRRTGTLFGRPGDGQTAVTLPVAVTDYRTVVVEWTPRSVRWTLDGTEVGRTTAPRRPHYLALQALVLAPDCGTSPLPASCPRRLPLPQVLSVDRVTIQPYTAR